MSELVLILVALVTLTASVCRRHRLLSRSVSVAHTNAAAVRTGR